MDPQTHRRNAWYPILAVGAVGTAFSALRTARDALFFQRTGLEELPAAYFWTEVGLFAGAYVHLAAMKRFGTRRTRTGLSLGSGVLFLLFAPLLALELPGAVEVLFPLVPVMFAALFSATWLLAGDLLEDADRATVRWAFGLVAASAMIGGMGGSLLAKALSMVFTAPVLVGTGGGLLLLVSAICSRAHRLAAAPGRHDSTVRAVDGEEEPGGLAALARQPYVKILFVISAVASLVGMYVEFRFYAAAYALGSANAGFFANYYFILSLASLVMTLVVAPRVQSRRGVGFALLVLPAGVLGGAGLVGAVSSMLTQSVLRVVENGLKNSIHRSSWEQVFLPFARAQRGALKVLVDGVIPRAAGVAGAVVLYFTIVPGDSVRTFAASSWVPWLLAGLAALWIHVTLRLRRLGCDRTVAEGDDPRIRLPDT